MSKLYLCANSHYRIMNEISTLKNQVSNCTCDKKVHVLKKCVSKMEKLFQHSEKEYVKQIEQLRQELELKENALQVMKQFNIIFVTNNIYTLLDERLCCGRFLKLFIFLGFKFIPDSVDDR